MQKRTREIEVLKRHAKNKKSFNKVDLVKSKWLNTVVIYKKKIVCFQFIFISVLKAKKNESIKSIKFKKKWIGY